MGAEDLAQGSVLKAVRIGRNLRQEDVAVFLGVRPHVVRDWELGLNRPTYDQMVTMAQYLGCNLGDLLTETERPQGRARRRKAPAATTKPKIEVEEEPCG